VIKLYNLYTLYKKLHIFTNIDIYIGVKKMLIFNFIISIILILIIFWITASITKTLLYIFTKYEYESYYLLFPTLLCIGSWCLSFILWYFTVNYFLHIDIIEILLSIIIKETIIESNFIIASLFYILLATILQSIAILTINIDYKKITGNTRFFFKKLFKVRTKKNGNLIIKNDPERITFIEALAISILIFVIVVLTIVLLFFIGFLISKKIWA
jgi:hypothetical protein